MPVKIEIVIDLKNKKNPIYSNSECNMATVDEIAMASQSLEAQKFSLLTDFMKATGFNKNEKEVK